RRPCALVELIRDPDRCGRGEHFTNGASDWDGKRYRHRDYVCSADCSTIIESGTQGCACRCSLSIDCDFRRGASKSSQSAAPAVAWSYRESADGCAVACFESGA